MIFFNLSNSYNLLCRADKVYIENDHAAKGRNPTGVIDDVDVGSDICVVLRESTDDRRRVSEPTRVLVPLPKLPRFWFPAKVGDTIEYELAESTGVPAARSAKFVAFANRSFAEIEEFFSTALDSFSMKIVDQVLDEVLRGK